MKTAMQEFSEWLKAYEYELPLELQVKAKECLEKEKEQICNAYVDGLEGLWISAEEYYNREFNQEPKKEYGPSKKYLEKQKELMEDFIWNKMNKNK
jgi:hypothetical protein